MPLKDILPCATADTPIQFVEVPVGNDWRLDIIIEGRGRNSAPLLRSNGWTYAMIHQLYDVLAAVGKALEAHCSESEQDEVNDSFHMYNITCPNCQGKFVLELGDTDYHVPEKGGV